MAQFSVGTIEATLTLDKSAFIRGLEDARKEAQAFTRKPLEVKLQAVLDKRSVQSAVSQMKAMLAGMKPGQIGVEAVLRPKSVQAAVSEMRGLLKGMAPGQIPVEAVFRKSSIGSVMTEMRAALAGRTTGKIGVDAKLNRGSFAPVVTELRTMCAAVKPPPVIYVEARLARWSVRAAAKETRDAFRNLRYPVGIPIYADMGGGNLQRLYGGGGGRGIIPPTGGGGGGVSGGAQADKPGTTSWWKLALGALGATATVPWLGLPYFRHGTLGALGGLGPVHLLGTGVALGTAFGGALLGGGLRLLGTGAVTGVGMLTDMAGIGQAAGDIRNTYQAMQAVTTAVMTYGKRSQQAAQAQAQLNTTLHQFSAVARPAVRAAASHAVALRSMFDQLTGPAERTGAQIINQGLGVVGRALPIIAKFANENMKIIQKALQPLFTFLKGPGMQILTDLEKKFQSDLPLAMNAFVNGVEVALKMIDFLSKSVGTFLPHLDRFLKYLNTPAGTKKWEADFTKLEDLWKRLVNTGKLLFDAIKNIFKADAGTGPTLLTSINKILAAFDKWSSGPKGKNMMHTMFEADKKEILAILAILPHLLSAFGQIELIAAPKVTSLFTTILDFFNVILRTPVIGQITALGIAFAYLGKQLQIIAAIKWVGGIFGGKGIGGLLFPASAARTAEADAAAIASQATAARALGAGGLVTGAEAGVAGAEGGVIARSVAAGGLLTRGGIAALATGLISKIPVPEVTIPLAAAFGLHLLTGWRLRIEHQAAAAASNAVTALGKHINKIVEPYTLIPRFYSHLPVGDRPPLVTPLTPVPGRPGPRGPTPPTVPRMPKTPSVVPPNIWPLLPPNVRKQVETLYNKELAQIAKQYKGLSPGASAPGGIPPWMDPGRQNWNPITALLSGGRDIVSSGKAAYNLLSGWQKDVGGWLGLPWVLGFTRHQLDPNYGKITPAEAARAAQIQATEGTAARIAYIRNLTNQANAWRPPGYGGLLTNWARVNNFANRLANNLDPLNLASSIWRGILTGGATAAGGDILTKPDIASQKLFQWVASVNKKYKTGIQMPTGIAWSQALMHLISQQPRGKAPTPQELISMFEQRGWLPKPGEKLPVPRPGAPGVPGLPKGAMTPAGFEKQVKSMFTGDKTWLTPLGKNLMSGLHTGITSGWKNVGNWFKDIQSRIKKEFTGGQTWLKPLGEHLMKGLHSGIQSGWKNVGNWFKDIKSRIKKEFTGGQTWLKPLGENLMKGLHSGIEAGWKNVGNWFKDLKERIKKEFTGGQEWLTPLGKNLMEGLHRGITDGWKPIDVWFKQLHTLIKDFFAGSQGWLTSDGLGIMQGLYKGLQAGWKIAVAWFHTLHPQIVGFFSGAIGWLISSGMQIVTGLVHGLQSGLGAIRAWASSVRGIIMGAFAGASGWLVGVGQSIGAGLASGLSAGVSAAASAAAAQASAIGGQVKAAAQASLKAKSPSRLMADEVGKWIPLGIAAGISEHKGAIVAAIDKLPFVHATGPNQVEVKLVGVGGRQAAPAQTGPIIHIQNANFHQDIDLKKLMNRADFLIQHRRTAG